MRPFFTRSLEMGFKCLPVPPKPAGVICLPLDCIASRKCFRFTVLSELKRVFSRANTSSEQKIYEHKLCSGVYPSPSCLATASSFSSLHRSELAIAMAIAN